MKLGSPVSAILQEGDIQNCFRLPPRSDSIFEFVTTGGKRRFGRGLTLYEIFEDSRMTKLLAFNDNYNGTGLSRASVYMARGQTVYVRVRAGDTKKFGSICKSMRAEASMTCHYSKGPSVGYIMNSPCRSQAAITAIRGAAFKAWEDYTNGTPVTINYDNYTNISDKNTKWLRDVLWEMHSGGSDLLRRRRSAYIKYRSRTVLWRPRLEI